MTVVDDRAVASGPAEATAAACAASPDADALVGELEALLHTNLAGCLEAAERAVQEAAERRDLGAEMVAHHYVATARRLRGDDAGALAACDRTALAAAELGNSVWQARSLECRALVHHAVDDDEQAIDLLREAVDLCRRADDDAATAEALTVLGRTYAAYPSFAARAAGALAEARRLSIAAHDPDGAAAAQVALAMTYVTTSKQIARTNARGAVAAARRALEAARLAVEEADAAGLSALAVDARLAVATSLAAIGDDAALGTALESLSAMLERFPSPAQQLTLHHLRATWLSRRGLLAEAERRRRARPGRRRAQRTARRPRRAARDPGGDARGRGRPRRGAGRVAPPARPVRPAPGEPRRAAQRTAGGPARHRRGAGRGRPGAPHGRASSRSATRGSPGRRATTR